MSMILLFKKRTKKWDVKDVKIVVKRLVKKKLKCVFLVGRD